MLNVEPLFFHSHCTRIYFHNLILHLQSLHFPPSRNFLTFHNLVSNSSVNKPHHSHVMCGIRGENHVSHWKRLSADDIVSRAVDVVDWTVHFESKCGVKGKVSELIQVPGPISVSNHAGTTLTWLKVVESPERCVDDLGEQMETHVLEGKFLSGTHTVILKQQKKSSFEGTPLATEILIPVVDEFVKKIDIRSRILTIFPPKGLLELARRPEAIKRLRPIILEFCKQNPPEKVRKRLKQTRIENLGYMPTLRQLEQAGLHWLIKEIKAAGGLIYVAQALNLHVSRRPAGYWDNLTRVDIEIECFIWECWTKRKDKPTETDYYWNPVTNEVSQKKPPFPNISDFVTTKKTVMPRRSMVMAAKRWDLHRAIIFHGGYKAVAYALQRWTVFVHGRETRGHIFPEQICRHLGDVNKVKSETIPTEEHGLMSLSQVKLTIKKIMKSRGM